MTEPRLGVQKTNVSLFRLSLRLRSKTGSDCSEIVEKTCENIVLFRPLPYACTPSKENSQCLSMSNMENINCY